MKTIGVICEYNPLHLGHAHQLKRIREKYGEGCRIVCLMSGNYVQRGMPAILDKQLRARAAILAGADLVLELPVTTCLSSAEGYASGGVEIAHLLCDVLSFGVESLGEDDLFQIAGALDSDGFSSALKDALALGISFPAARQRALEAVLNGCHVPVQPNDILATEYCRTILKFGANMEIFPIARNGSYHSEVLKEDFPSATAVRAAMHSGKNWASAVPDAVRELFSGAELHSIAYGERAILYRLRTMTEADFSALPYGSEGLWRRFFHACRESADLNGIIARTKTKRYTRTRIDRMVMCAFLGITNQTLHTPAPYVRILAFNDRGRSVIRDHSEKVNFLNCGAKGEGAYWELEQRCSDLYGLFAQTPEEPGRELRRRISYDREQPHEE